METINKPDRINFWTWDLITTMCKFDEPQIDGYICFYCGYRTDSGIDLQLHCNTYHFAFIHVIKKKEP